MLFEWNNNLPIERSTQSDHAAVTFVILLLVYREGKNNSVWVNVERESQSNQVILIGIRTEVSRHFKVIIVLGFGTCRLGFSQCWVTQENDQKLATVIWAKCNEVYICSRVPRIYQRHQRISISQFSCTQHPGHSKPDTGSRFTQKHERIGSQYKSKTSNIILTSFYTISCYWTHWRPLQSSSSLSRAPLLVLLSRCSGSWSQLLQVVHQLVPVMMVHDGTLEKKQEQMLMLNCNNESPLFAWYPSTYS
jgi:hypothetical protein